MLPEANGAAEALVVATMVDQVVIDGDVIWSFSRTRIVDGDDA